MNPLSLIIAKNHEAYSVKYLNFMIVKLKSMLINPFTDLLILRSTFRKFAKED